MLGQNTLELPVTDEPPAFRKRKPLQSYTIINQKCETKSEKPKLKIQHPCTIRLLTCCQGHLIRYRTSVQNLGTYFAQGPVIVQNTNKLITAITGHHGYIF